MPGVPRDARDGRHRFRSILVVQEIFGLHEHIKDVCRRSRRPAISRSRPSLYARQGDATKVTDTPTLIRDIVSEGARTRR